MAAENKTLQSGSLTSPVGPYSNVVLAFGLMTILATLLIKLPTPLLDMLLACSISLSVAVLIITLSSREALELSTFPSLLLFVTLFRLSLNVASTKLILLQGNAGNATFKTIQRNHHAGISAAFNNQRKDTKNNKSSAKEGIDL